MPSVFSMAGRQGGMIKEERAFPHSGGPPLGLFLEDTARHTLCGEPKLDTVFPASSHMGQREGRYQLSRVAGYALG